MNALDDGISDAIGRAYGHASLAPARRISERVWRLSRQDGDVAIKFYAGQHAARAHKEAAVLAHLNEHGDARFRVQTLLHTMDGQPLWSRPGDPADGHAHALATRWQAGLSRTYNTYTPAEWLALGISLARLHLQLESPTLTTLARLDTLAERLAAVDTSRLHSSLAALASAPQTQGNMEIHAYANACRRMLDVHLPGSLSNYPQDDPSHLIHNDYNQFNYLFDGQLPPVILDWEAAIGAPREYEVVRCLNHLPLTAPALAAQFMRGYLAERPLRSQRISWAVDTACLQHALKRWIWEGWLREPARFASSLDGAMTMTACLAGARGQLIDFFAHCIEMGGTQQH